MNSESAISMECIQVNIDMESDSQFKSGGGDSPTFTTMISATDSGVIGESQCSQTLMEMNSHLDDVIDNQNYPNSKLFRSDSNKGGGGGKGRRRRSFGEEEDLNANMSTDLYRTYSGSFQDSQRESLTKHSLLNITTDSGIVSDGSLMRNQSRALRITHSMYNDKREVPERKRSASWQDPDQSLEYSREISRSDTPDNDTMNQMETAIEISNDLLDKEDQIDTLMRDNTFLSNEIQSLEAELITKESELTEYRLIIREQQNQLTNQRSTVADCKIQSEKFKVENMAKTGIEEISHALLNEALSENEELKHEIQVINHESAKLQTENQKLRRENDRLVERFQTIAITDRYDFSHSAHASQKCSSFNDKLTSKENNDEDTMEGMSSSSAPAAPPRARRWMNRSSEGAATLEEDRSKEELLRTIRQMKDDKIVWEQYACFLLRNIVEIDINLLHNRGNTKDKRVSHSENRQEDKWEMFSKSLVNYVLKRQPQLLNDFMTKREVKVNDGKDVLI